MCQEVAAQLGWRVLEVSAKSISIKEIAPQFTGFTWPARIDVQIVEISDASCDLRLDGSIAGMGPIQRNHLQGQMGRFLNNLSLLLDRQQNSQSTAISHKPGNGNSMSEELARLKSLRDDGVLTDEEFAAAKSKLLAP